MSGKISPNYKGFIGTMGGVPTGPGGLPLALPQTLGGYDHGNYYFVGKGGNDGSDGKTWGKRKLTIASAITAANADINWSGTPWGSRSVIVIGHGTYAENLTSLPHGCVMIGEGSHDLRDAQNGVKIKPATGSPVVVSAVVNTEFYNIGFETGDGSSGSYAFKATIVNNCLFDNCFFTGPAETATIGAAFYTSDSTKTTWRDCWFANADVGFDVVYADGGDGFNYGLIDHCIVSGCDTAGIRFSTNLVGPHSLIRDTHVYGGGQTMALGLDDNSDIVTVNTSYFEATANDPASGAGKYNASYLNGALIT
jgi:hypothetical protein